MRIKLTTGLGLAAVLIWSGCIPSLNPFYTEKDLVFEATLLGEWQAQESEKPDVWRFEAGEGKTYKLTTKDAEGRHGEFTACLFRLESHLFLDLVPADCRFAEDQADLVAFAMPLRI